MRRCFLRPILIGAMAMSLAGCIFGGPPEQEVDRACLADLDRHAIAYTPVPQPEARDPRCAINTAVRVERVEERLGRPALMACAMASRLDRFEHEVVEPLALRDLGRRVTEIEHLGAYACRDNTSTAGRLSEHAFGRAIDISGFRFSDGSTAIVARDWGRDGPMRRFLYDVARNACRYFSVVLTPDLNRDHYNHFHLDIGPGKVCSMRT